MEKLPSNMAAVTDACKTSIPGGGEGGGVFEICNSEISQVL